MLIFLGTHKDKVSLVIIWI